MKQFLKDCRGVPVIAAVSGMIVALIDNFRVAIETFLVMTAVLFVCCLLAKVGEIYKNTGGEIDDLSGDNSSDGK